MARTATLGCEWVGDEDEDARLMTTKALRSSQQDKCEG